MIATTQNCLKTSLSASSDGSAFAGLASLPKEHTRGSIVQKLSLCYLLGILGAFAQAPTVTVAGTDNLSHSVVRVKYNVSAPYVNARTRYVANGTCTSGTGGSVQQMSPGPWLLSGQRVVVGGLSPNTTYQICPEVTADNTNWSSGAGVTITTLPLPAIHPAPPIPPQTFSTAMPNISGYTSVTVASDCSDYQSKLNTAVGNQLVNGTIINIAPGTTCGGAYMMPGSPDNISFGASAVSVANSTITLPNHGFTEGQGLMFGSSYSSLPASASCVDGSGYAEQGFVIGEEFYAHVIDGNTIQVYCNNSTGMSTSSGVLMSFTSQGSGTNYVRPWNDPALNWVIVRTSTPDAQFTPIGTRTSPAWASKMAVFTKPASLIGTYISVNTMMNVGANDANIQIPVSNVRFIGIEITTADASDSHTATDPTTWAGLIQTWWYAQNIIWDRCYIHLPGNPARVTSGWYWDGSNQAVLDSYMDNLTFWKANYSGLTTTAPTSTTINVAPGNFHIAPGVTAVLPSAESITLSGTATGNLFIYYDLSGNFTLALPPGISATCTGGAACTIVNDPVSYAIGGCNYATAGFPHGSTNGNISVGPINCTALTNGQVTGGAVGDPNSSRYASEGSNFMIGGNGPGPYLFQDNYVEGAGLTWHHDDSGGDARIRTDYTYNRNTWMVLMAHMYQTQNSDGFQYAVRHCCEWKSGGRIAITGSIFDGATSEDTPIGDFLEYASDNGGGTHDVFLENNTFEHGPAGFFAPEVIHTSIPEGPPPVRFTARNNLLWDISQVYHSTCCFGTQGGKGWIMGDGGTGEEDTVIDHNTIIQNTGVLPSLWYVTDTLHEGVQITNNFLYLTAGDWGFQTDHTPCPSGQGKVTADCLFTNGYRFDHNVLMSNSSQSAVQAAWPNSLFNYIPANPTDYSAVGFFNYDGNPKQFINGNPQSYNFRLSNSMSRYCSRCGSAASDLRDVGADINALEAAQGKVTSVSVPPSSITASTATIGFVAPDSQGCPVDFSSSDPSVITSFTRVADAGGLTARNIALSGLTTGTTYYFRVNCAVEQPMGQFLTK